MSLYAHELARARWRDDVRDAQTQRLANAIRRRRASERSEDRARRLNRLAALAAQRSGHLGADGLLPAPR